MEHASDETLYRVRALPGGRTGRFLLILWAAGMGGMFIGLLLTFGNPVGGMVGLLLPMVWLGMRLTRRTEFGVGPEGVSEAQLDPQGKPVNGVVRRWRWDQVESWSEGADLIRNVGERRQVEIRLRDGYRIRFREPNEKPGDPEFSEFARALRECAEGEPRQSPGRVPSRPPPPRPVRRPSFYERPVAKVITVLFLLICVALLLVAILEPSLMTGGAWFRLLVVILPGTAYMFARTFGRR